MYRKSPSTPRILVIFSVYYLNLGFPPAGHCVRYTGLSAVQIFLLLKMEHNEGEITSSSNTGFIIIRNILIPKLPLL